MLFFDSIQRVMTVFECSVAAGKYKQMSLKF